MGARETSAFGSLLRAYREAASVSQERLAERAGMSLRGVSDLERGARRSPRLETVRMLADALGLGGPDRAALLAARGAAAAEAAPSPTPETERPVLPVPSTPLVGRAREVGAVVDLLRCEEVRLVTLTGPGGVGKTRLALAVAHRLVNHIVDGAVFVDLSPIRDPTLVLPTVAAALGVRDTGDQGLPAVLATALRDRQLLLILDNCEQIIDAAPDIGTLMDACPSLTVLATSRVVLRLAAEHIVPIPPLQLPDAAALPALPELARAEAVAMFVARARAADPAFALTQANVDIITALVGRLDGLPLAIELAAARVRTLAPEALLARLERQLPLLTGGARDAPVRQRTMRDAIAWSHDLLEADEQALFRRLAIFVGGCTLEAAEAVVTAVDGDPDTVLDGITSLIDKSLVRQDTDPDGEPRYRMLETVREFGLEELAASGEEANVRSAAHAAWYRRLAREAEPMMARADQVAWLDRLEWEHDNLRSGVAWLIAGDRIEEALDLAGSLWFFRWLRGYYAESRQQYEELLTHPLGAARTAARAKALNGVGVIAVHQGDAERSLEALEEAIGILRDLDERRALSLALLCHGTTHIFIGRIDESEALYSESRAIAEVIGDRGLVQAALASLGNIAASRGQWELARERMEAAVQMALSLGDTWSLVLGHFNLAVYDLREGALDSAERHILVAVPLIKELGDMRDLPAAYSLLAEIARQRGKLAHARSLLAQAHRVAREIGDRLQIAQALTGLGQVAYLEGDHHTAIDLLRDAMRNFEQGGDRVSAVGCLDIVAEVVTVLGDARHAAWCIGAVDGVLERHGQSRFEAAPGEHQARVEAVIAALGEPTYRQAWAVGHALDTDAVLAEAFRWQPPPATAASAEARVTAPPDGRERLSPRELEVLRLLVEGNTDREIADALYISRRTVTSHTTNIFAKLGVTNRVQAATVAIRGDLA